jgi:hypothetical protein
MTYVVNVKSSAPDIVLAVLADFEQKVPEVSRRAEISGVFRSGTRRLLPEEIPERLRLEQPLKNLRDIFISDGGVLIVSRALHDLLEEMDPGVHQFSPIAVERLSTAGERFVLNVYVKQDSIIDEQSNVRRHAGMPDNRDVMYINYLPAGNVDITLDRSKLAKVNLWREKRYPGSLLLSDELNDELKRHDLKFFVRYKSNVRRGQFSSNVTLTCTL